MRMCFIAAFATAAIASPLHATAQTAPASHLASPGVYQVLQENKDMRMVLATWNPGQRDEMHSHPTNATYALTPCHVRLYGADGKELGESKRAQGSGLLQGPAGPGRHSRKRAGVSKPSAVVASSPSALDHMPLGLEQGGDFVGMVALHFDSTILDGAP